MTNHDAEAKIADEITKMYVDKGRIIELGWQFLRTMAISKDASGTQLKEMRMAFFAGAQHCFGSMMSLLEPGNEATENDLRRLTLINQELEEFIEQFKQEYGLTPNQG